MRIGELSRRTGVPVRTIRFYSDSGLLSAERSESGYRTYGEEAVTQLELVRTLRSLGIDLPTIRRVLARERNVAEIAAAHAAALDVEIRALTMQRALLRLLARSTPTDEEMATMRRLAQLSDDERKHMVTDLVEDVFAGLDPQAPVRARMAAALPELGVDPSPEALAAWIELAGLIRDPSFRARVREMAVAGAAADSAGPSPERVAELAGAALAEGIAPDSAAARQIADELTGPLTNPDRAALADRLETFTDPRVERYWQLLAQINGWPTPPSTTPAWSWLISTLRAERTSSSEEAPQVGCLACSLSSYTSPGGLRSCSSRSCRRPRPSRAGC
jgi:DNA-binding transcriptional MerR regulator